VRVSKLDTTNNEFSNTIEIQSVKHEKVNIMANTMPVRQKTSRNHHKTDMFDSHKTSMFPQSATGNRLNLFKTSYTDNSDTISTDYKLFKTDVSVQNRYDQERALNLVKLAQTYRDQNQQLKN
jgi:hypothetical protein